MKLRMTSLVMTGMLVLVLFASATAVSADVITVRGKVADTTATTTETTTTTVVPRAADGIVHKYAIIIGFLIMKQSVT